MRVANKEVKEEWNPPRPGCLKTQGKRVERVKMEQKNRKRVLKRQWADARLRELAE